MPRYTAEQIYAFARQAGFSPDQAATFTAVAFAESGGNSIAHNPHGEDSRGLWQINVNAHPQYAGVDLYDPLQNARAAFEVSHGGSDISPWTTTHGGLSARYLRYRAQAEAAAMPYGDGPGHGMWTGTSGYGDRTPAGSSEDAGPPGAGAAAADPAGPVEAPAMVPAGEQYGIDLETPPAPGATGEAGASAPGTGQPVAAAPALTVEPAAGRAGADYGIALESPSSELPPPQAAPAPPTAEGAAKLEVFLDAALAQTGDRYIFGAETKMDDPDPSAFDCSELVEWSAHRAGVEVPDGAWAQYTMLHGDGSAISVQDAINTPGALLFSFSSDPLTGKPTAAHVAISLGDGKTIEAKGTQYGVGSWEATPKRFQYAALIPGLADGGVPPVPPAEPTQPPDAFDYRLDADPARQDAQPATVEASEQLTEAAPSGPEPQPGPGANAEPDQAEPDHAEPDQAVSDPAEIASDVDVDGVDDALAHATELAGQHEVDHDTSTAV